MVVISHAVDIAIQKASTAGISVVGVNEYASATGAIGHWSYIMARKGFISIVMSQCPEMVAPHGSHEPIYGTNPLAMGIPLQHVPKDYEKVNKVEVVSTGATSTSPSTPSTSNLPEAIVLDMATSAYAWYGLVAAKAAGEPIPNDIAYNSSGQPTTDPSAAMVGGALRSFDRSYKGSHLALMVELLAGAFTGASMVEKSEAKNWGTLLICIDPNLLGDRVGFTERAQQMCLRVQNAKLLPVDGGIGGIDTNIDTNTNTSAPKTPKSLYLPGQRGDEMCRRNMECGTIPIKYTVHASLLNMCS